MNVSFIDKSIQLLQGCAGINRCITHKAEHFKDKSLYILQFVYIQSL